MNNHFTPAYGGNGNNNVGEATQAPQLQIALNELDKYIDELQLSLKALEERLSPVLLPDSPKPTNNPGAKDVAAVHSQSVGHLCSLSDRVLSMLERVSDIKNRLEV